MIIAIIIRIIIIVIVDSPMFGILRYFVSGSQMNNLQLLSMHMYIICMITLNDYLVC